MQGRMSWWRSHGGEWETRWVKGHVDRDGTRAPDSYTIAEQLSIAADGVAGWAGGLTERKAGAQGHQNGRQEAGGEWRACGAADPYWGAVAPFILDMASQRAAREYWAARQHNRRDGLQHKEEVVWDTRVQTALGRSRRGRRALHLFRTQLW